MTNDHCRAADAKDLHCYAAYGLNIHSEVELPELTLGEGLCDLRVRVGAVTRSPDELPREFGWSHVKPHVAYFHHRLVGTVLIREGREIVVDPLPEADARAVRTIVANMALGVALHQRGILTFHASAVAMPGGVVAFIGDKGWGKSTMAAAFHRQGCTVLTDDVLGVVHDDAGEVAALPGYPQVKLWPDAIAGSTGADFKKLDRVYGGTEKRVMALEGAFPRHPLPLRGIYVLVGGDHLAIERLAPRAAFMHLLRHSYAVNLLQRTRTAGRHLNQCTDIIEKVPVCLLKRPTALELLPVIAEQVEQHALCDALS